MGILVCILDYVLHLLYRNGWKSVMWKGGADGQCGHSHCSLLPQLILNVQNTLQAAQHSIPSYITRRQSRLPN